MHWVQCTDDIMNTQLKATTSYILLDRPTGLFGVAMSPRSASHRPRHDWRALRDVSPTQGWISDPHLPSSAPHGSHCLSRDFTRSAKPALEKQTSQLSPAMHQCMDSAWVWLLAGPIKCNWPSVTLWSVFQYPVTYIYILMHEIVELFCRILLCMCIVVIQ